MDHDNSVFSVGRNNLYARASEGIKAEERKKSEIYKLPGAIITKDCKRQSKSSRTDDTGSCQ